MSFKHISPERRIEIARLGGQTAQARGVGHRYTPSEASLAGVKGAAARAKVRRLKAAEDGKYLYAISDKDRLVCLRHPTYKVGHPPGAECPYCWKMWYLKESKDEVEGCPTRI